MQKVLTHLVGYGETERADLLHDVFIRAFERVGDLRNPRSLKHWLTRIAVLRSHEWFRLRKRSRQHEPIEYAVDRWTTSLEPRTREGIREFYALIGRFKDDERSVFILRFVEGMSLQEVAEVCDLSFSTARRRILRADTLFKRLLPQFPALLERMTESTK